VAQPPAGPDEYLILDARYEKVRQAGRMADCAVLVAIGVDAVGRRSVLGVSVSLSEAEVHWREFFKSLGERGLHGVELIVSDAHAGLQEADGLVSMATICPDAASKKWYAIYFHP
jgi:putative transposase